MTSALRFAGVSFQYPGADAPALTDVTCDIAAGERVALLGKNGAGKSTLTRLIAGLCEPTAGTVSVGDWDTRGRSPETLARRVGTVFQHADQQLFGRTVAEDVAFGPRALGLPPVECAARVERAIAALDLGAYAAEHPYDLPAPYRKLAALAGALALEPVVLVLDEPTAGLDRALRAQVARALTARAAAGTAVLVVTHDLGFAAEVLTRGLVLDRGRLVRDEPLDRLLTEAASLAQLGLVPPPVAALSLLAHLPGTPVRERDAAQALRNVAGGMGRV